MYGDQQAYMTGMRAAYGDVPPGMYGGAGGAGYAESSGMGAYDGGASSAITQIGSSIRPVTYTPPARTYVGAAGQYMQETGFLSDLYAMMRVSRVPQGVMHADYMHNITSDFGERLGGGLAAGGMTAAGLAVGATAGSVVAGGLGAAVGSVFGPLGMAAGGFLGSNIGGYMLGMAGVNKITEGLQERRAIQGFLESTSTSWVGAGSSMADPRRGAGLSATSRRDIADFMGKMDIEDTRFDLSDLTSILQKSTNLGLFTGTTDVEDFKKKFKDITENVRTVTKVLHQTLEEGLSTIKDLKGIGIGAGQAGGLALQADALGKVSGRTGLEMMNLGLQGAEMFRGTGVDMSIGYQSTMMNLASVRSARDAGMLSQQAIAHAGGEEALAQRATASGLMFSQSGLGRGYAASFFNGGVGAEGFNKDMFYGAGADGGGLINRARAAANALNSPQDLIRYEANQEDYLSELGKAYGGQGLKMMQNMAAFGQANMLVERGAASNMDDALKYSFKEMGLSHAEVKMRMSEISNSGEAFRKAQAGAAATRDKMIMEGAGQNFVLNRWKAALGDAVKGAVDPVVTSLNETVDDVKEGVITSYEENFYGMRRSSTVGVDTETLSEYEGVVSDIIKGAGSGATSDKTVNLDVGGLFSSTPGEKLLDRIERDPAFAKRMGYKEENVKSIEDIGSGRGILGSWNQIREPGKAIVVRSVDMAAVNNYVEGNQKLSMTEAQAKKVEISDPVAKSIKSKFSSFYLSNNFTQTEGSLVDTLFIKGRGPKNTIKGKSGEDLIRAITGKDISEMSNEEWAALRNEASGTEVAPVLDAMRENFLAAGDASDRANVEDLNQSVATLNEVRDDFKDLLDIEDVSDKTMNLVIEAGLAAKEADKEINPEFQKRADQAKSDAAVAIQREAGIGAEEAKAALTGFITNAKTKGKGSYLSKAVVAAYNIKNKRAEMGSNIYQASLISHIDSEKGLTPKQKSEALLTIEKLDSLDAFMSMSDDELEKLPASMSVGLINLKEGLSELKGVEAGDDAREDTDDALRKTSLSKARRAAIGDVATLKGGRAAMEGVFKEVMASFTPQSNVSAAGNAETGEGASGKEEFILQTNINRETLAILQNMHAMMEKNK